MRTVGAEQRRALLVARHRLAGDAPDVGAAVASVLALHATDPATVVLSVLARSRRTAVGDVTAAMHDHRALVRWMAMRRTLFVLARGDVPMVQAAVGTALGRTLRRRLLALMERNGVEPAVDGDPDRWLARCEAEVESALARLGSATGAELRNEVPGLGASIPARTRSERRQNLTSPLLTAMGAAGRLVRGQPVGAWTTRSSRWEPVDRWWPDGLPRLDEAGSRAALARRWLERYGPATAEDLEWWTGWTRTATRRALADLDLEEVDLDGRPGIDLADADRGEAQEPVACLLPALDPTPMGWKHRDWFTPVERGPLYDTAGNIGPTVWWGGEIVGGWAVTPDGVRVRLLADRGKAAADAVGAVAHDLERRLDGTVVTPAARTPLERELSSVER